MNIYLVSQNVNPDYDTYDSFVVVANSEEEARNTHPDEWESDWDGGDVFRGTWARADEVKVELIGKASKKYNDITRICCSFNAG